VSTPNNGSTVTVNGSASAATIAQAAAQALAAYVAGGPPAQVIVNGQMVPAGLVNSNPSAYANGAMPPVQTGSNSQGPQPLAQPPPSYAPPPVATPPPALVSQPAGTPGTPAVGQPGGAGIGSL
jgi:hypothetical protein